MFNFASRKSRRKRQSSCMAPSLRYTFNKKETYKPMKQVLRLFTTVGFALIAATASADDYKYLTFTSTSGSQSSLAISGLKLTFNGGLLTASQAGTTVTTFNVSELAKMMFTTGPAENRADVNRDGTVDSADIVAVIKEMPDGDTKADVNNDGAIDSADIVAVIKAMK